VPAAGSAEHGGAEHCAGEAEAAQEAGHTPGHVLGEDDQPGGDGQGVGEEGGHARGGQRGPALEGKLQGYEGEAVAGGEQRPEHKRGAGAVDGGLGGDIPRRVEQAGRYRESCAGLEERCRGNRGSGGEEHRDQCPRQGGLPRDVGHVGGAGRQRHAEEHQAGGGCGYRQQFLPGQAASAEADQQREQPDTTG